MTEFWVSQKQHFCEYCKIFIANNAASKGMHENGLRHKENVAKRLADMRRRNIVEKREKEQVASDLERIEWKARRQYEKDLAQQVAAHPSVPADAPSVAPPEAAANDGWVLDDKTGYYYDPKTKYTYDPNSGLYYTELTGRWTTQDEAVQASQQGGPDTPATLSDSGGAVANSQGGEGGSSHLPRGREGSRNAEASVSVEGEVIKTAGATQKRKGDGKAAATASKVQGVQSPIAVKRKRESDTPKVVTAEESAAIAAREAAKKRLEDRTKKNYGFTFG